MNLKQIGIWVTTRSRVIYALPVLILGCNILYPVVPLWDIHRANALLYINRDFVLILNVVFALFSLSALILFAINFQAALRVAILLFSVLFVLYTVGIAGQLSFYLDNESTVGEFLIDEIVLVISMISSGIYSVVLGYMLHLRVD